MGNNDRVNELYYGRIFNRELQQVTRDRIHWTCKQVRGEDVLDIGCSQGITSILLGREGFNVTGLDIEKFQIEYANNELKKEEPEVQSKVNFEYGNAITYDFGNKTFDTIIIGEVIEHISQPKRLYEKIFGMLRENGRVIISTPFGLNEHYDHKTTYYLTNFLSEIDPYFVVDEFKIIGKWICLSTSVREEIKQEPLNNIDFEIIKKAEQSFLQIEQKFLVSQDAKNEKISTLNDRLEKLNSQISKLKANLNEKTTKFETQQTEHQKYKQGLEELRLKLSEVEREKKELESNNSNLETEKSRLQSALSELSNSIKRAVISRDKNIRFLQNRLTVVEQSTGYKMASLLSEGVKKPTKLPKNLYLSMRAVGGGFKRKVKGTKKKYKLVSLPYAQEKVSYYTGNHQTTTSGSTLAFNGYNNELDELKLTGLFNAPNSIKELRVAAIMDEFSLESFKHDCELITFKPDNWKEVLTLKLPHLLLVESAWKGNGGSWQYKIGKYNIDQGTELDDLLQWCKNHNIPTVFWNKEDPIHFDKFIQTARKFDHVYTTDDNCIARYKEVVGHDRVYVLPFAAQPTMHNPIQLSDYKKKNVCFAGSYYANRHEERKKDQEELLDSARAFGLEIFDRNYSLNQEPTSHMRYPERFEEHIVGSRPYHKLVKDYKRYKVFLNVNSVQDSGTMFSRRVFELLACGTSVVSTYSKGIKEMFGELVPMVEKGSASKDITSNILENEQLRVKNELKGIREVFTKHTYSHRLHYLATNASFDVDMPYQWTIHLIAEAKTQEEVHSVIKSFSDQDYQAKRLTIFVHNSEIVLPQETENIELKVIVDDINFEGLINLNEDDFVGFMFPQHFYGKYYLTDLLASHIYSNAEIIGKSSFYSKEENVKLINEGNQYLFTPDLHQAALIIKTDLFENGELDLNDWIKTKQLQLKDLSHYGIKIFSNDAYNFVLHGSGDDHLVTQVEI
ncbi:methyltransferase domain-containing protein [Alkalihalophilus marmarensis]|uniref:methyltransferase domain-containing protein n=1 Tax=Alkalihalophilus marmarensis TaxID=521377 RepID=UPI002E1B5471|nr:methyltransferase [Alkalihalophilus marmarensis]